MTRAPTQNTANNQPIKVIQSAALASRTTTTTVRRQV